MIKHKDIWQAIDRLAGDNGYSPSGLAKKAGLDSTSFNKSKRVSPDGKPRWPSTESISKILGVTGVSMGEFVKFVEANASNKSAHKIDKAAVAAETAKILLDTKSVLFDAKKPFTLKSGALSPVYTDCRRLISFAEERETLMRHGANLLLSEVGDQNIDVVAGGETAGIPYGAFIAEKLNKPMIYVRKEPKGYGRMAQIEGALPDKGKPKTILVEDLQTDGGSKKIFVDALRDAGTKIDHAFVIFHYGIFKASEKNLKSMKIKLHALTTWWDVIKVAKEEKYFDPDTLSSVEAFLNDPDGWRAAHNKPGKAGD